MKLVIALLVGLAVLFVGVPLFANGHWGHHYGWSPPPGHHFGWGNPPSHGWGFHGGGCTHTPPAPPAQPPAPTPPPITPGPGQGGDKGKGK
jgi:hypothetical protein